MRVTTTIRLIINSKIEINSKINDKNMEII